MLLRSYKLHDITYNNCNCSLFSHRLTFYTLFYFAPVFNISGTGSNHWDECSNYGPTKDESSINAVWILITLISATAIIIHSHFIKYSFRLIFLLDLTLESCFSLWGSQNATNVRWEFCIQGKGNIVSWIIVTPAILTITENANLISFVWQNNEKIGKKKNDSWNPPSAKQFSCLVCFICLCSYSTLFLKLFSFPSILGILVS